MKKLLALILFITMSMLVVGCNESIDEDKWIDEASAMLDKNITSGQFILNGVVYEFPMDVQYWLDNGWHVSNNYENIDEFTLDPGSYSTEFELYNDDKQYVKVTVINTSNDDAKIMDCMVYSLKLNLSKVDAVFPQGITKRSKPAGIKDVYGEPQNVEIERDFLTWTYRYITEDEWKCVVEIEAFDNNSVQYPCNGVKYYVMSFDTIWENLMKEKGVEEACNLYIDATMNASYIGDFTSYLDYCIDSKTGAEELYNSEIEYYSEFLRYYVDIDEDYVSDEDRARFNTIAKKVISKVMWKVESVEEKSPTDCEMVLKLYPTNFLDIVEDDITDGLNKLYAKYNGVDITTMSDAEYDKFEKEYVEAILVAMEKNVDKSGTKDAVTKTYKLDVDGVIVSEETWIEIDDIVMDVSE